MQPVFSEPVVPAYTNRAMPAKRHIPFINTAPELDKGEHLPGEPLPPVEEFGEQNWQDCETYLYAIDLFNQGYWWEAHELLKPVCLAAGRESEVGQFIEGLIQLTAAQLKHYMREEEGARRLVERGLATLTARQGIFLGIDIARFASEVLGCMAETDPVFPRIKLVL